MISLLNIPYKDYLAYCRVVGIKPISAAGIASLIKQYGETKC